MVGIDKKLKEEKEMEFIHNIKNVYAVDIEFLSDDSQIRLQVGAGEDIYMFLLEGEAAKNYAKNYGERCCRLIREKHDLEKLNDKLKMDNHELIMKYNTTSAEKYHFKKERDELFDKHNVLVLEHDSLLEKYKEQEAKIAELQIEKTRIDHDRKRIIEEHRKSDDEQCDRFKDLLEECTRLKKENHELALKMRNQSKEIDKLDKRNKYLNKQIDEIVLNANKGKEEEKEELYSLDNVVEALDKALDGFSDRMNNLIKEFADIFCEEEVEIKWEEQEEKKMEQTSKQVINDVNYIEILTDPNGDGATLIFKNNDDTFEIEVKGSKAWEFFRRTTPFTDAMLVNDYNRLVKENDDLKDQLLKLAPLKRVKIIKERLGSEPEKENTDEEPHSRRDILRCAEKCVCGKREQDYGTPENNFQLIADIWNAICKTDIFTPELVSLCMIGMKTARIVSGGGSGDSWVDIAGYAACGGEIWHGRKEEKTGKTEE